MNVLNVGGTMTGGATVVLSASGLYAGGKASFTTPDHTRLNPQIVDFLVTPMQNAGNADPGVARSGLKVSFASRVTEEGCCTPRTGSVIIDVGFRWPLSQPDTVRDDAIELMQALWFNTSFLASLRNGTLPVS